MREQNEKIKLRRMVREMHVDNTDFAHIHTCRTSSQMKMLSKKLRNLNELSRRKFVKNRSM
jgi:predicted translin family RNA/ssDNA-binding protein